MNIYDFESYVDSKIIERGYDYYLEGSAEDFYRNAEGQYIFDIQGSEDYEIVVKIDEKGEIIYSQCDCPYDYGDVCKHEVAAFYKLKEIIEGKDGAEIPNDGNAPKNTPRKVQVEDVLNDLSKEELIKLILSITERDNGLKDSIILKYSKGSDAEELKKCENYIRTIVKKHVGRDYYIPYGGKVDFIWDMEEVIDKIKSTDSLSLAMDMALILLNESVEAFKYADDSDGDIGMLIDNILELMDHIAGGCSNLDEGARENIFNRLLQESERKTFDGWEEFRTSLLRMCSYFGDIEELRNRLKVKIEKDIRIIFK